MFFLFYNNANVQFGTKGLTQRLNTAVKALAITSQVELIDKRVFVKAVLDRNSKTFVVYLLTLKAIEGVYLF